MAVQPVIEKIIPITQVTLTRSDQPGQATLIPLRVHQYRSETGMLALQASADFEIDAAVGLSHWAFYAERLEEGGRIAINGVEIAFLQDASSGYTVRESRPYLLDIPAGVLRSGRNTVVRNWSVQQNQILVARWYLGSKHLLSPIYEERYFWQHRLAQLGFVFAVIMSFILLGLYAQNRSVKHYLWIGASAAGWAVVNLSLFLPPVPSALFGYWQWLLYLGSSAFALGGWFYLMQDCGWDSALYKRFCLAWVACFSVAFLIRHWATGLTLFPLLVPLWAGGLGLMGILPAVALVQSVAKHRRPQHIAYLTIVMTAILGSLLDILSTAGITNIESLTGGRLSFSTAHVLPLTAPAWFTCICLVLINDFTRSLRAQQRQGIEMALQLVAQKQELDRLHALERIAQEKHAAAQERSRIMQDMHDGLGSQLVSSLALARGGELSAQQTYELLRSCIDDLRLAIDTSSESQDSLALSLGNLRFRMEPRLNAAGIALHMDTAGMAENLPLPDEKKLPVLRIIKRA